MVELNEKEIKREELYAGTLLKLRRDTIELPSGKQATREVIEHPGAIAIVAVTKDKQLIFVRQFRTAVGEVLYEIPAGVPHKNESGADCAKRELEEETGYRAKKVSHVWQGYATPGYSDELIQYYFAEDLEQVGQKTDEDEFIEIELIEIKCCPELVKQGKIKDNKTLIGITIANGL